MSFHSRTHLNPKVLATRPAYTTSSFFMHGSLKTLTTSVAATYKLVVFFIVSTSNKAIPI